MKSTNESMPVNYADVAAAAAVIKGVAHRTPALTSRTIDERTGARVFFKCENLQRMGAFKFRGAYNALSRLDSEQKRRGVIAYSSGNHAQAVALAGRLLGVPTVIVMPDDAPTVKLDATRGYGAEVVVYNRQREDREQITRALAEKRGLTMIRLSIIAHVIAGQGTAAKELIEDVGPLDHLLVPCGGGGLIVGLRDRGESSCAWRAVTGVEPAAGDDVTRSFQTRCCKPCTTRTRSPTARARVLPASSRFR